MICSSLNLLRFISFVSLIGPDSTYRWRKSRDSDHGQNDKHRYLGLLSGSLLIESDHKIINRAMPMIASSILRRAKESVDRVAQPLCDHLITLGVLSFFLLRKADQARKYNKCLLSL